MSTILFDRVVITQTGDTVQHYDDVMFEADLTATAYLDGVALDPQPSFKWYSSDPRECAADQSGNCMRGTAQIRAVALLPDGSESGVEGIFNLAVQDLSATEPHTLVVDE